MSQIHGGSDMVKKPDRVHHVEDDAVAKRVGPGWIWIFPTQVYMPTLGNPLGQDRSGYPSQVPVRE